MKTINIKEDFTEFPGLRYCSLSDFSGEEFYHTILNLAFKNAIEQDYKLSINLDYTDGYASSFLDEAFGNLIYDFTLDEVRKRIEIISTQEPHWKEMIETETFLQWEKRRKEKKNPTVTAIHNAWFRLDKGELKQDVWEKPM